MFKRLYYIILQRIYVFKNRCKPCQGKVYMFHNVNNDDDTYSISKENFITFIDYLLKNKKIVDINTMIKEKDPDNVVISFDDVYESVFYNAYPVLKEKGVPYYLFICNEYYNTEGYLKSYMALEMLMHSEAIIASHGFKHDLSRFMAKKEFNEGLKRSKNDLEKEFVLPIDAFAFPFGSMYACSEENIKDAGEIFEHVLMTYPLSYRVEYGNVIPRININDKSFRKEMR